MPDPETQEMQVEQVQREQAEREQKERATEPEEERTHSRRADKAAYLRKKLDERARSEDER